MAYRVTSRLILFAAGLLTVPVLLGCTGGGIIMPTTAAPVQTPSPEVLLAYTQWLDGVAAAAASYGCIDTSIRQGADETVAAALNRFALSASPGSCLVLYPVSTDVHDLRYSLASGGTIRGKPILYISDIGRIRIWNGVEVAE